MHGTMSAKEGYIIYMADGSTGTYLIETVGALSDIDKADWDRVANPPNRPYHPLVSYDFLEALEASGSIDPEKGWAPCHLILEQDGQLCGAMPAYFKGHSQGEYIFDHAWADAYERAGGNYYPKLLSAVPFTPVPGPRFLATTQEAELLLANAAMQIAGRYNVSSFHVNFVEQEQAELAAKLGYLQRLGQQFHFQNRDYAAFDDFLECLSSRKRKNLRKERASIAEQGVEVEWLFGNEITENHLDQFWIFYQDTGARKWGSPYLTRVFFSLLLERMPDKILLIMAKRDGQYIAGALNIVGGDALYGRYWGCTTYVPNLHFEVCYYQAIDYAITHQLRRVEAGAQGEHKIARGYEPVPTYSVHWIRDEGFRHAVAQYLESEKHHVEGDMTFLKSFAPFKKG